MFKGTNRVETRGILRPSVARKELRKAGNKNGPDAVQHPTRQMKVRDMGIMRKTAASGNDALHLDTWEVRHG